MQPSDWIASGALLVSLISAGVTIFYTRTQHRLNKLQVAEKEREAAERSKARFNANLITGGKGFVPVVRFVNVGKGIACNVTVKMADGSKFDLLAPGDIADVTPIAEVHGDDTFKIIAVHNMNTPAKNLIEVRWNNESGEFEHAVLTVLMH